MNVGRPPDDLTVAGASGELCGLRVDYHDDECGLRVPFQPGLAAQPRVGSKPIDTVSCLLPEARGLADAWRHPLIRDPTEAELFPCRAESCQTPLGSRIGVPVRWE